jgi:hypothetical protein
VPVAAPEAPEAGYGRFPDDIERDWLGRWCHLSEADVSLVRRRAGDVTRLGFAAQLVTVRAMGTFLADPSAVPAPIVASLVRQLDITDPGVLAGYGKLPVRWKHSAEIRERYGYRGFASQPGHLSLLRWLYRQAWADELGPSVLFRAAHRRMLADRVVLPGENVLTRLVGGVRERATRRLWSRLAHAASPAVVEALEALLVVPTGSGARSWTDSGARRSAPASVVWSKPSNASGRSEPWASAVLTCPACHHGGWPAWPATPRTPGPPSSPTSAPSDGLRPWSPSSTCSPPAPVMT